MELAASELCMQSFCMEPESDSSLDLEDLIVAAVRRLMRAIDLHSRRLVADFGLTGPQLAT
ncbi:MAG: hypothetical protein KDC98_23710, partial [Planctomycetes bacterium]|nr:hypothetical protein [Planctomycetota bacterium]